MEAASSQSWLMLYSVAATVDTILANGGEIVRPNADAPGITARFRDREET